VPELLVAVEPFQRVLQRFALEAAIHDAACLLPLDQSGIHEDAEVLHENGQRHRKRIRELAHGALALTQPREDRASGRVRQRAEDRAERIACIVNHAVKCIRGLTRLSTSRLAGLPLSMTLA
jgi:hypothetical protein